MGVVFVFLISFSSHINLNAQAIRLRITKTSILASRLIMVVFLSLYSVFPCQSGYLKTENRHRAGITPDCAGLGQPHRSHAFSYPVFVSFGVYSLVKCLTVYAEI
jgi:hypothetical protein